jgi:hypothetical protein
MYTTFHYRYTRQSQISSETDSVPINLGHNASFYNINLLDRSCNLNDVFTKMYLEPWTWSPHQALLCYVG